MSLFNSSLAITLKASLTDFEAARTGLSAWTITLAVLFSLSVSVWLRAQSQQRQNELAAQTTEYDRQNTSGTTNELPRNVRVSKLLVHPIKSCKGLSVKEAVYTPEGLEFDRMWAIIDSEKHQIITAREVAKMVLIQPRIEKDESSPHLGRLIVDFPLESECATFSVPLRPTPEILRDWQILPEIKLWPGHGPLDGYICEAMPSVEETSTSESPSAILSKYFGKPVDLVYKGPRPRASDPTVLFPELKATAKYQDMYPLLLLSGEGIPLIEQELRGHVGTQGIQEHWKTGSVAIERFRPNIILSGGGPFAEDGWEELTIGTEDSPTITLVSRCTRCLLPNVSPETGVRDAAVPYKVLMKFRTGLDPKQKMKPCVGCNGVPTGSGVVKVGDSVFVRKLLRPL